MMSTGWARKGILATYGAAIAAASAVGVVFACTSVTAPYIGVTPADGPAASTVTVSGGYWSPGTLTLNWYDGSSAYIATLGTANASGGSFASNVVIPGNAAPGTYYIGAVQGSTKATAAFTVDAPTTSTSGGGPSGSSSGSGSGSTGSGAPSGGTSSSTSGGTGSSSSGGTVTTGPSGGTAGTIPGQSSGSSAPANSGSGSGSSNAAWTSSGSTSGAAAGGMTSVPTWASSTVVVGSGGTITSGAQASPRVPTAVPGAAGQRGSSKGSLNGDLWGGFGKAPASLGAPSAPDSSTAGVSDLEVGLGLAMAALVAIASGFAVAEVRTRRARINA